MVVTFLNTHKGLTIHNRKFWLTMHVFLPLAHASNGGLSKFPPWHRRQDSTSYLRVLTWHPVALYRPLYYRSHINIQHHALQIQNLPYHIAYSLSVPPVTHNSSPPYQWQVDMVIAPSMQGCQPTSHHAACGGAAAVAVVLPRLSFLSLRAYNERPFVRKWWNSSFR